MRPEGNQTRHLYVPVFLPEEQPRDRANECVDCASGYYAPGITDQIVQNNPGLASERIREIAGEALEQLHPLDAVRDGIVEPIVGHRVRMGTPGFGILPRNGRIIGETQRVDTASMLFGVQTPTQKPWAEVADEWRWLDGLGIDSLWLADHLIPPFRPDAPIFEAWTALAGLATVTSRARIGILVSCNTFRHPGLLAKEAVTVDHISGGRLDFGLGAGWFEPEHAMYGVPFPDRAELVARFRESVEICHALFNGELVSYPGKYYQLTDALFRPAPLQNPLPMTLAGQGPKMMKIVARYASRWNFNLGIADMQQFSARLDEACVEIGRDPADILRSHLYVPAILPDERPWDSADAFADYVGRYRELGIRELILQPLRDMPRDRIERIVGEAMPAARAAYATAR